jgi:drug/metabolite transporter (DMT)-like permease
VGAYDVDLLSIHRMGIIAGLASAMAFAWYSVQSEYGMDRYSPWTVLVYALLFAAPIWNILQPPLEAFTCPYSTAEWGWILFIAVFGTVFPFGFYNKGIRQIQSAHAGITATLKPIIAAVISYLFLNEVMEVYQFIGAVLVIASISLLQIRRLPA